MSVKPRACAYSYPREYEGACIYSYPSECEGSVKRAGHAFIYTLEKMKRVCKELDMHLFIP